MKYLFNKKLDLVKSIIPKGAESWCESRSHFIFHNSSGFFKLIKKPIWLIICETIFDLRVTK